MDVLPFDSLYSLFEFLPIIDLDTVSKLGGLYEEAALSVARRRHRAYEYNLWYSPSKPCNILVKCMHKLTVESRYGCDIPPFVVNLITSAELLVDLTIYNMRLNYLHYTKTFLSRIQRLKLVDVIKTDVAAMLRTCSPDTLTELTVSTKKQSDRMLLAVNGQLDELVIDVPGLNFRTLFRMCKKYPRLQKLRIGGNHLKKFGMSAQFWESECLLHLQELRLWTRISLNEFSLAKMPELHTLELWFEDRIDENSLLKLCRTTGPTHKLRMLWIRAEGVRLSKPVGEALLHLAQLHTFVLRHAFSASGEEHLLQGIASHPALRSVELSECMSVYVERDVSIPKTLFRHMQRIEHLTLQISADDELVLLARMAHLRTLRVTLTNVGTSHLMVIIDQLVQHLAAANTLTVLQVQMFRYDTPTLTLDPLTTEALRRFSSLRELKLCGPFVFDTVQAVLCNMPELESFGNDECSDEVSDRLLELKRMRPEMRISVQQSKRTQ